MKLTFTQRNAIIFLWKKKEKNVNNVLKISSMLFNFKLKELEAKTGTFANIIIYRGIMKSAIPLYEKIFFRYISINFFRFCGLSEVPPMTLLNGYIW